MLSEHSRTYRFGHGDDQLAWRRAWVPILPAETRRCWSTANTAASVEVDASAVVLDFHGFRLDLPIGIGGFMCDVAGFWYSEVGKFAVVFGPAVDIQAHDEFLYQKANHATG
jgi:hypothetical protein